MTLKYLELNDLRGITIFYKNDFFDFAEVVLKILILTKAMNEGMNSQYLVKKYLET